MNQQLALMLALVVALILTGLAAPLPPASAEAGQQRAALAGIVDDGGGWPASGRWPDGGGWPGKSVRRD